MAEPPFLVEPQWFMVGPCRLRAKTGSLAGTRFCFQFFRKSQNHTFGFCPMRRVGGERGKVKGRHLWVVCPEKCRPEENPRGQRLRVPAGLSFTHGKKF